MDNYSNPYDPQGNNNAQRGMNEQQEQMLMSSMTAASTMQHVDFNQLAGYGSNAADTISVSKYNMIIGLVILAGFVVNAIMLFGFGDRITNLVYRNSGTYVAMIIGYFVSVIAGTVMIRKSDNPVVDLIGYALIVIPMGIIITPFLSMYSIETLQYAFCVMGFVALVMIGISYAFPNFMLSIGRMLFGCLVIGLVAEIVMWALGFSSGIFDFFFIGIFCGYIGYDWAVAQKRPKTVDDAIDSASMIYVDLINLLIRILRIMARSRSNN